MKIQADECMFNLRRSDSDIELTWCTIVCEPEAPEIEWHETQADAEAHARSEMSRARVDEYTVCVYVLKCHKQNGPVS